MRVGSIDVGAVHDAQCPCGFQQDIAIGMGYRSDSADYFPLYGQMDGFVRVNLRNAVLLRRTFPRWSNPCPACGNMTLDFGEPVEWEGRGWHGIPTTDCGHGIIGAPCQRCCI